MIEIIGECAILSPRHKLERLRYLLLRHVPFFGRNAYLRYHQYLVSNEVVVPDERGAKWMVMQIDGRIRYVAANLYARHYDVAYRLGVPPLRDKGESGA